MRGHKANEPEIHPTESAAMIACARLDAMRRTPVTRVRNNIPIFSELDKQVLVLCAGRLASAVGTGLTIFYAPIFFVNVAGISATSVGIGIGCGGAFGIFGRFLGGSCADSPKVGRRGSLLLAASMLAAGAFFFAATEQFWQFVIGNVLIGLGVGFYWPSVESFISDVTEPEKLNEAFGLTRLADYIGLGLGVIAGGLVIGYHGAYRLLFILDGISYLLLFAFVLFGIKETLRPDPDRTPGVLANWKLAFKDRNLILYALLNLIFTNNIMQMSSTLPLYFSNFVSHGASKGLESNYVSLIFSTYIVVVSSIVMPIARLTSSRDKSSVLMGACLFWGISHTVIALLGLGAPQPLILSFFVVISFAVANALYGPSSSSLVVEMSPKESRATYLSINSLCWGIAGSIGPAIGLAALDFGLVTAINYWFALAIVNTSAIGGLIFLRQGMQAQH